MYRKKRLYNKKNQKDIDLQYLVCFNFLKTEDYKKLRKILEKYFYEDTPFGKLPNEAKIELLKKIYFKIIK